MNYDKYGTQLPLQNDPEILDSADKPKPPEKLFAFVATVMIGGAALVGVSLLVWVIVAIWRHIFNG